MMRLYIILLVGIALLTSCSFGGYEEGDGALSHLVAEYVDITVHENTVTDMVTDGGEHLTVAEGLRVEGKLPTDTMLRRLLYYNKVENGKAIEVVKTVAVAVVKPHEAADIKEMKTDPVKLTSMWMAQNGRYVNVQLGVMMGNDAPEDAQQLLMFRCDSVSTKGKGHVFATLYHDQADVPQYYTRDVYLSIPMAGYDTITVRVNTYSGVVERTLSK